MSSISQHSNISNVTHSSLLNHKSAPNSTSSSSTGSHPSHLGPPTSRDAWRNLFTGRIATLVYLKSVLSGKTPYASLVLLSQRDLHAVYDSERMRKRSHRHLLLGLALSPLLELQNIADFSKGVLNAFSQVDSLPESFGSAPSAGTGSSTSGPMASLGFASLSKGEGRGMRNLFSSKKGAKKGGTFTDLYPPEGLAAAAGSGPSGSSIQTGPSMSANSAGEGISSGVLPFSPDFMQVFFTLADTLIEVYSKMALLIAREPHQPHRQPPSGAKKWPQQQQPQQQQQHNQQGSVSSIQPGSLSTDRGSSPPSVNLSSSGGITEEVPDLSGSYGSSSASFNTPSSMLIPSTAMDNVAKVDTKIKKIIVQISKELDTVSRHIIKDELAHFETGPTLHLGSPTDMPGNSSLDAFAPTPSTATPIRSGQMSAPSPWTGLPQPPMSTTTSGPSSMSHFYPRQHRQPQPASSASSFAAPYSSPASSIGR